MDNESLLQAPCVTISQVATQGSWCLFKNRGCFAPFLSSTCLAVEFFCKKMASRFELFCIVTLYFEKTRIIVYLVIGSLFTSVDP